ncbi:FUSC family protein [Glaciibacter superstes]|uniref:FUSC family protein n=1 Tax=Glaciibacter superstes TaxID=501023 RepID=UPI0003B5618E|nr:aromatic acid exporter family protein [Glaciibacter superstes]
MPQKRRSTALWLRYIVTRPRLLLALKTAFAATVAWFLAPLIPLADADYSYYAPLGAVVSMYPTLVRSLRTGFQALLGLALGAGLAFATLAMGVPRGVGIALVVGVGVLLAGVRVLGEGRSWVPITGLFVLLIGGANAEDYSINYLVHMVLGVVVGLIVNFTIIPPIYLQRAGVRLNRLRDRVAERMRDLAEAIEDNSLTGRDWEAELRGLDEAALNVRGEVQQAEESRRGNPRGRKNPELATLNHSRMRALERVLFFVRDLTDVVGGFDAGETTPLGESQPSESQPGSKVPDAEGRDAGERESPAAVAQLVAAVVAVADLVASPFQADESARRLADAESALDALNAELDARSEGRPSAVAESVAASVCLRRIVEAARPFAA